VIFHEDLGDIPAIFVTHPQEPKNHEVGASAFVDHGSYQPDGKLR
jgi:hypothetical protein